MLFLRFFFAQRRRGKRIRVNSEKAMDVARGEAPKSKIARHPRFRRDRLRAEGTPRAQVYRVAQGVTGAPRNDPQLSQLELIDY